MLAEFHRIFSQTSLFEIYFFLTAFFWLFGGVTLYFLVKTLGQRRQTSLWSALIFLLGPFLPWLFPFGNSTYLIGFSFLPLILLLYLRILQKWSRGKVVLLAFLIALVLLIDNLILPAVFLGMFSLFLAVVPWGKIEKQLKRTTLILILGFALATIWYTPSYWLNLLSAPSFAGKGLSSVIVLLTRLLSVVIPTFLAIFSVKRFRQRKNLLLSFAIFWSFIFGFLTLIRFLSDPDFWQDWTSYGLELQMGGAILLGMLVSKILKLRPAGERVFSQRGGTLRSPASDFFGFRFSRDEMPAFYPSSSPLAREALKNRADSPRSYPAPIIIRGFLLGGIVLALTLPWILAPQKNLGIRRNIENMVEYRVGEWLAKNVGTDERVYLSGTTAFWLNSLFDLAQVRGGFDQSATHPYWAKASYEIREGEDGNLSVAWLEALGVSYLIVHGQGSEEYYHDFKSPEKFETTSDFTKLFEEKDDHIYRVEGGNLARVIEYETFKEIKPLQDGEDKMAIKNYAASLGRRLKAKWPKPDEILVKGDLKESEGINLAVTWDRGWKCEIKASASAKAPTDRQNSKGGSQKCKIESDALGNILIAPKIYGEIEIRLWYK